MKRDDWLVVNAMALAAIAFIHLAPIPKLNTLESRSRLENAQAFDV